MNENERGLPDPLCLSDGAPVSTPAGWTKKRRPEILELFRAHVYGRASMGRPPTLCFTVLDVTPGMMNGRATRKRIAITYASGLPGRTGSGRIDLTLFVPTAATAARPAPAFLLLCNRGAENIDPTRAKRSPFWPAEEIVARGYATAALQVGQIAPDDSKDGFRSGVFPLFDPPGPRAADAWGTIAAWAWGASRALDYLITDAQIDARRVAVVGHSRGGKTALWAGAEDERFALAVSNDSGCTGAALARGTKGETIAQINRNFPHWFCADYKRYNDRANDLPVDQHELLALMAPRPVYVASATQDAHADPPGEFAACVAAGPVYRLLGLKGLEDDARMPPPPDHPLRDGNIGYHIRTGTHDLTLYDWNRFMDFADRHLRP